jgi:hypothetical protein
MKKIKFINILFSFLFILFYNTYTVSANNTCNFIESKKYDKILPITKSSISDSSNHTLSKNYDLLRYSLLYKLNGISYWLDSKNFIYIGQSNWKDILIKDWKEYENIINWYNYNNQRSSYKIKYLPNWKDIVINGHDTSGDIIIKDWNVDNTKSYKYFRYNWTNWVSYSSDWKLNSYHNLIIWKT